MSPEEYNWFVRNVKARKENEKVEKNAQTKANQKKVLEVLEALSSEREEAQAPKLPVSAAKERWRAVYKGKTDTADWQEVKEKARRLDEMMSAHRRAANQHDPGQDPTVACFEAERLAFLHDLDKSQGKPPDYFSFSSRLDPLALDPSYFEDELYRKVNVDEQEDTYAPWQQLFRSGHHGNWADAWESAKAIIRRPGPLLELELDNASRRECLQMSFDRCVDQLAPPGQEVDSTKREDLQGVIREALGLIDGYLWPTVSDGEPSSRAVLWCTLFRGDVLIKQAMRLHRTMLCNNLDEAHTHLQEALHIANRLPMFHAERSRTYLAVSVFYEETRDLVMAIDYAARGGGDFPPDVEIDWSEIPPGDEREEAKRWMLILKSWRLKLCQRLEAGQEKALMDSPYMKSSGWHLLQRYKASVECLQVEKDARE